MGAGGAVPGEARWPRHSSGVGQAPPGPSAALRALSERPRLSVHSAGQAPAPRLVGALGMRSVVTPAASTWPYPWPGPSWAQVPGPRPWVGGAAVGDQVQYRGCRSVVATPDSCLRSCTGAIWKVPRLRLAFLPFSAIGRGTPIAVVSLLWAVCKGDRCHTPSDPPSLSPAAPRATLA